MNEFLHVYTDASTKDGISGIAMVVTDDKDKELYKKAVAIEQSCNNTAELCAVLFALEMLPGLEDIYKEKFRFKHLTIYTDSDYVVNAVNDGKYQKEEEKIVKKIRQHMADTEIDFVCINGHSRDGNLTPYFSQGAGQMAVHFNKCADKMAKEAQKTYEKYRDVEKKQYLKSMLQEKYNLKMK